MLPRVALTLVSLLVALVAAEVVLRVAAPLPFSTVVEYAGDGYVRKRLVPNRVYALPDGGRCTVNRWGYRGENFRVNRPEGVFRIVALGGSSTFSYLTDDQRIWTHLLEGLLARRTGLAVEVINAGIPGYTSFDSKLHYLYRVRSLSPDAVIVYHTWNDLKGFHHQEWLRTDGKLRFASAFREPAWRVFLRRFQLAWRVNQLLDRYAREARREDVGPGEVDSLPPIAEDGGAHRWARQNFDDLASWMKRDGVLPILVSQAGLLSRENLTDPATLAHIGTEYQTLEPEELVEQWEFMGRSLREVAARHGTPFLDARAAIPHTLEFFRDHVHLTERGNAMLAEWLAEELLREPAFRDAVARQRERARGTS